MAKSDVGTITVYLEAMSKGFDSSLKGASKAVKGFEGSIKQSGMAFTEFQSKIGVMTGAIELFGKVGQGVTSLMSGDIKKMEESFRTLPFGIGSAFGALAGWRDMLTGAAEETAELEKATKKLHASYDAYAKSVSSLKAFEKGSESMQKRTDLMSFDKNTVAFEKWEEGEKIREGAAAQISSIDHAMAPDLREAMGNKITMEMEKQLAISEEYWAAMQKVEDAAAEKLRIDNAINTTLADRAKQAAQDIADIRSSSKHELGLMKALGASQSDIDKRRLQAAHQIDKVLESQATHAKNMTFDRPLRQAKELEEVERKRALHAVQTQQGIESSLAGKLAEKKNLENQSPAAVASSFSTAVGQIVLPDARQSGENRRAQLEELKKINGSIAQLNSSLASARGIYP